MAGAFFVGTSAFAADYPTQAVTIIVPSKAGGSTDITARIFSEVAESKYEGFEFVISNMGGSGGQKGFEAIARAKADGYTIGLLAFVYLIFVALLGVTLPGPRF